MGSHKYDYYRNLATRQYKYFVIPQMLILDEQFSTLSDRAKILYCVMLDRSSMSARNGWIDDQGRVYIIMARDEIMEKMGCSHTTAHKYIQELIDFGLIKKQKRGQGKPDVIYVMNFNSNAEDEEESLLQEGKNLLPQEGKNPLPQEGKNSLPQEGKNLLPQEGKDPLPQEGKNSLPQEGKNPLPQEGKNPLPQEGKNPLPQEGKDPLPQEGKDPLPLKGKDPCPKLDLYNKTNINKSSSSESESMEDDEYIRQCLGYEQASQRYPPIIVDLLYRELTRRDPTEWSKVNQTAFAALCRNVTDYHGQVANVEAYIARCIDNVLVAVQANIASSSPPKGKNRFNDFQQNIYDFSALEEKLLSKER